MRSRTSDGILTGNGVSDLDDSGHQSHDEHDVSKHDLGSGVGAVPDSDDHTTNENKDSSSIPLARAADPFDPEHLRLPPNFSANLGVVKALVTVPVRKPSNESFVQVHPAQEFTFDTYLIELKEDGETFIVAPALWPALAEEVTFGPRRLCTTITRQGDIFLWPLKLPREDGRANRWHESALEAARLAKGKWVRVSANMHSGAYDVAVAMGEIPPPVWPNVSINELVKIAFHGRYIDDRDHLVLRRLRGEA